MATSIVAAAAASAGRRLASRVFSSSSAAAASTSSASSSALHVASVEVPEGVSVTRRGSELTVAGPLGTSRTDLAALDGRGDGALRLSPDGRSIEVASVSKPFFGTLQSLLKNKIEGVTKGFYVQLRIVGIGYRAALSPDGSELTLKLGHSHDCSYRLPPSLRAVVPEPTLVGLWGLDKNQVTQAAANIIALRRPSPYKGKGVRIEGTTVKLKPGKRK